MKHKENETQYVVRCIGEKFKIEKMCMGENGKLICCRCKKECEPRKNYTINVVMNLGETKQIYDLCDKCTQYLEKWIMSYSATKNIAPCPSCKTSSFDDIFIRVIGGYKITHLCKYRVITSSTIFETKDKAIAFWNNHIQNDYRE